MSSAVDVLFAPLLPLRVPRVLSRAQAGILDQKSDAEYIVFVLRNRRRRARNLDDRLHVGSAAIASGVLVFLLGEPAFGSPEIANQIILALYVIPDAKARREIGSRRGDSFPPFVDRAAIGANELGTKLVEGVAQARRLRVHHIGIHALRFYRIERLIGIDLGMHEPRLDRVGDAVPGGTVGAQVGSADVIERQSRVDRELRGVFHRLARAFVV